MNGLEKEHGHTHVGLYVQAMAKWLAVALVIAAAFPYVIYVLRDILSIEMPVNLVFLLMFCFVLVVLLSLSIAITQLAEKCKRLTQANAILEKRVRDLEGKNR